MCAIQHTVWIGSSENVPYIIYQKWLSICKKNDPFTFFLCFLKLISPKARFYTCWSPSVGSESDRSDCRSPSRADLPCRRQHGPTRLPWQLAGSTSRAYIQSSPQSLWIQINHNEGNTICIKHDWYLSAWKEEDNEQDCITEWAWGPPQVMAAQPSSLDDELMQEYTDQTWSSSGEGLFFEQLMQV